MSSICILSVDFYVRFVLMNSCPDLSQRRIKATARGSVGTFNKETHDGYFHFLPPKSTRRWPRVRGRRPGGVGKGAVCSVFRSEERRVGKGCRSRGWPYH